MNEKNQNRKIIPKLRRKILKTSEKRQRKISIVIPAYNEEDSLKPLFIELRKVFNEMKDFEFEVIIVDDGSTDNSLKILNEIKREDDRFKFISFQKNYGTAFPQSIPLYSNMA